MARRWIDEATGLPRVIPDTDGRVSAWLAFESGEAISVAWVTPGRRVGVWEMMTPARHRRKGDCKYNKSDCGQRAQTTARCACAVPRSHTERHRRALYRGARFRFVSELLIP